jgi:hypothetical protein
LKSLTVVLFSIRDQRWKLADFGTTSQATSKRLNTTHFSRGTSSYRAPEIVVEDSRYNNKADIFAFGCIIYEVVTAHKLFSGDMAVWEYAIKGDPLVARRWPDCDLGSSVHSLGRVASALLEIDPSKRPSATKVARLLEIIRGNGWSMETSVGHQSNKRADTAHGIPYETPTASSTDDEVTQLFEPVFTRIYAEGDPGSGIGGYDLKSAADRVFEFDYLHSGTPDHLVLYRPGTGTISIVRNKNGAFGPIDQHPVYGTGIGGYDLKLHVDRIIAFDYEHSGKLDYLVLYRPGTGTISIVRNNNGEFGPIDKNPPYGTGIGGYDLRSPADRIIAFDYEHSGKLDYLVLYRPGTGTISIVRNNNGDFSPVDPHPVHWTGIGGYDLRSPADRIFAFDYEHNGKLDHLVLYRPGAGTIVIITQENGKFKSVYQQLSSGIGGYDLKSSSDRAFAFDYSCTGKLDHILLYRPGAGVFCILRNNYGLFTSVFAQSETYGGGICGYDLKSPSDRMFPFAYFPNGTAGQLCLYRRGTGMFWILRRF